MDIQKNMNMQANISYLRIRPCDNDNEILKESPKKDNVKRITDHKKSKKNRITNKVKKTNQTTSSYKKPPIKLLKSGSNNSTSKKMLQNTATDLTVLLKDHGVDAEVTNIVPGPTVTRYEAVSYTHLTLPTNREV